MSRHSRGDGPPCTCDLDVLHGDGAHEESCARLAWLRQARAELLAELRKCSPDRAVTLLQAFDAVTDELAAGDPLSPPSSRRAARQHLRRSASS